MTTRRLPNRIFMDYPVPYEVHKEQLYPFGQVCELPAGQIFRFGRMGSTIGVATKTYQSKITTTQFDTLAVQTQAEVDDTTLKMTIGTTTITENEFAEGTVVVESAAALGHIYPIKSNDGDITSGNTLTATFADGISIQSQLTTSHKVTLLRNPWLDVVIAASVQTAMVIGIPQVIVEIAHHGWFQTHGFASVLADGSDQIVGKPVRVSETADGSVAFMDMDEASNVADGGLVGIALQVGVTGDFMGVFLKIE